MNYNANGGQRRSKVTKQKVPRGQSGFSQFMVSLVGIRQKHGGEIATKCLKMYDEKYKLEESEFNFLMSLVQP